jgi:flagellar biosynthesis protein FlhG
MLEEPAIRVFTLLSTLSDSQKNGMLINLSANLAKRGKHTLMVDAKSTETSIGAWLNLKSDQSLLEVAKQQRTMDSVIKLVAPRLAVTKVVNAVNVQRALPASGNRELSKAFDAAASRSDMVMVDGDLSSDDSLLLSSLEDSDMIIQVSADPKTIKHAYTLIKRLSGRLGRRAIGIVVTGASEDQANLIFSNLAHTANRYLAIDLVFVGFVPEDIYLNKANELGRTVMDAYPLSNAALAFSKMAEQLISTTFSGLRFSAASRMGAQLEI